GRAQGGYRQLFPLTPGPTQLSEHQERAIAEPPPGPQAPPEPPHAVVGGQRGEHRPVDAPGGARRPSWRLFGVRREEHRGRERIAGRGVREGELAVGRGLSLRVRGAAGDHVGGDDQPQRPVTLLEGIVRVELDVAGHHLVLPRVAARESYVSVSLLRVPPAELRQPPRLARALRRRAAASLPERLFAALHRRRDLRAVPVRGMDAHELSDDEGGEEHRAQCSTKVPPNATPTVNPPPLSPAR